MQKTRESPLIRLDETQQFAGEARGYTNSYQNPLRTEPNNHFEERFFSQNTNQPENDWVAEFTIPDRREFEMSPGITTGYVKHLAGEDVIFTREFLNSWTGEFLDGTIANPLTGRPIRKGGPTHSRLLAWVTRKEDEMTYIQCDPEFRNFMRSVDEEKLVADFHVSVSMEDWLSKVPKNVRDSHEFGSYLHLLQLKNICNVDELLKVMSMVLPVWTILTEMRATHGAIGPVSIPWENQVEKELDRIHLDQHYVIFVNKILQNYSVEKLIEDIISSNSETEISGKIFGKIGIHKKGLKQYLNYLAIKNIRTERDYRVFQGIRDKGFSYVYFIKKLRENNGTLDPIIRWEDARTQKTNKIRSEPSFRNFVDTEGMKQGVWNFYANSGSVERVENWEDDELNGLFVEYFPNGVEKVKGEYKESLSEGTWTYRNEDGSKWLEGVFFDDLQEGVWKCWDENGILTKKYYTRGEESILINVSLSVKESQDFWKMYVLALNDSQLVPQLLDRIPPPQSTLFSPEEFNIDDLLKGEPSLYLPKENPQSFENVLDQLKNLYYRPFPEKSKL